MLKRGTWLEKWLVGHSLLYCQEPEDLAGGLWQLGLQPWAQLGGFKRSQSCCSSHEADPSHCCADQSSILLLLLLHRLQAIPQALPELGSVVHTSAVPGETAASLP